uniref:Uncharacterized protein n=1 Tax=Rhizophora mucronata TaxID=61149 RepID=A0A2P2JHB0_RHIMU
MFSFVTLIHFWYRKKRPQKMRKLTLILTLRPLWVLAVSVHPTKNECIFGCSFPTWSLLCFIIFWSLILGMHAVEQGEACGSFPFIMN